MLRLSTRSFHLTTMLATLPLAAPALAGAHEHDLALAEGARPEVILEIALARNPDLKEARARVTAARARARQASRLPDPRLKYEQWGVPLRRPWSLGEAGMLMLGLSQSFPGPGVLDAQERVAAEDERAASATEESRRRDLRAEVRRAFADYYRANREVRLHREHVELTARMIELARASHRAGQRGQQDVLRLALELAQLHRDLAHIEQEEISARVLLNALMSRPPDALLGPPAELAPALADPPREGDEAIEARHPEIAAAAAALHRSEAALALARKEAHWPTFMVGADYWHMPTTDDPHAYAAMLGMSLPWLNPGKRDAVRAAEESAAAERHALRSVRNTIRYEIRAAAARHEAARSTFLIVDGDLLPAARRNFEAAQASYSAGQGDALGLVDALRRYLEVRLARVRAIVHLETVAADLESAMAGKEQGR